MCIYRSCILCSTKRKWRKISSVLISKLDNRLRKPAGPSPEERLEEYLKEREKFRNEGKYEGPTFS